MVASPLVEPIIQDGVSFIHELDEHGFNASAAFWLLDDETRIWRLYIASRVVDDAGPLKAYQTLQDILDAGSHNLALNDLQVVSPNNPVVQALRSLMKTGPGLSGIRVTGTSVNGVYIEDAYVYRLT